MSTQTHEGMYDDDDGYPNDGEPFGDKRLLDFQRERYFKWLTDDTFIVINIYVV